MSFHKTLQVTPIKHIGLPAPTIISPGSTVGEGVELMRGVSGACALVVDDGKLLGIVTERDVMNKVVGHPEMLPKPIEEIMSANPVALSQNSTVSEAIEIMGRGHYRNVPVIDDEGRATAALSVHAIVQFIIEHFPQDVSNLPPRPEQHMPTPDGA